MAERACVSIVCPSYGHERFVGRAIDSFLGQKYSDIEIIIVDDQSPDRSNAVISGIEDSRIKLLSTDFNMGISCAMNKGIMASSGSIICFCASDDMMNADHIERVVDAFSRDDDIGAVYARLEYVDEADRSIGFAPVTCKDRFGLLRELLLEGNVSLYAPGSAYKREVFENIGLFNPSLIMTQDYDFNVRTLLEYEIGLLDEPTIRYRRLAGDSNLSGGARWIPFCYRVESSAVFESFLKIGSVEMFNEIFKDASPERRPKTVRDIGYCLALIAIESDRPELSEWGFRKLGLMISDEAEWRRLNDGYGIDFKALRGLLASKSARDEAKERDGKDLIKRIRRKIARMIGRSFGYATN